jgi:hypothetical protein
VPADDLARAYRVTAQAWTVGPSWKSRGRFAVVLQAQAEENDYGAQQVCSWVNDGPSAVVVEVVVEVVVVVVVAWLKKALGSRERVSRECELDELRRVQKGSVDDNGGGGCA